MLFSISDPEMQEMQALEAHLRAILEQVRVRREALADLIDQEDEKREISLLEDQLQESSLSIADKCRLRCKLEDEIERLNEKIDRANQSVCRKNLIACFFFHLSIDLDSTSLSGQSPNYRTD